VGTFYRTELVRFSDGTFLSLTTEPLDPRELPGDADVMLDAEAATTTVGDGNQKVTGSNEQDQLGYGKGNKTINAGAGDDVIAPTSAPGSGGGRVTIDAGDGDDLVGGGDGDDDLRGGKGDDIIAGGRGNDRIDTGTGDDEAYGDDGADVFVFNPGSQDAANHLTILDYELGVDKVDVSAFPRVDDVLAQLELQLVDADNFDDAVFTFSNGASLTLAGIDWRDITADDIIQGNAAPQIIFGSGQSASRRGPENLAASSVITKVSATDGDGDAVTFELAAGLDAALFTIGASSGELRFKASADYDAPKDAGKNNIYNVVVRALDGHGGWATQEIVVEITDVRGTSWSGHASKGDTKSGTNEEDTLKGLGGNDTLLGLGARDTLAGGDGDDSLDGGAGSDRIEGGKGNDTFVFGVGDTLVELAGQGTDTVRSAVTVTLAANIENLVLTGTGAADGTGNGGKNKLTGSDGKNKLSGLDGDDTIIGGKGDDTLLGGKGADSLDGGAGKDRFVFDAALGASNVDRITGFKAADDTMALEKDIFTKLGSVGATIGGNAFWANTTGKAHDGTDRIIYDTKTGRLFYDSNGNASGGATQIALLDKGLSLTEKDFLIV
jgi:Ca2+-binding RTX toxin-like protein